MTVHSSSVSDAVLEQLTDIFRLMSDKTRLSILLLLREGQKNVTTLCEALNLPQPTVSHHLGLLRTSSLIENRRSGKQVFYGLSNRLNLANDGSLTFRSDGFTIRVDPIAKESD